eukprot:11156973-Lingulodinium_polyedra.AAC.1
MGNVHRVVWDGNTLSQPSMLHPAPKHASLPLPSLLHPALHPHRHYCHTCIIATAIKRGTNHLHHHSVAGLVQHRLWVQPQHSGSEGDMAATHAADSEAGL